MNIDAREWLETDGLGGFASGTACLVRTRRYHGLLAVATAPPSGRVMLVNGYDAWLETDAGTINLTTQRYAPDVLHPDGVWRLDQFQPDPWPTWRWRISEDVDLLHDLLMPRGTPRVLLRWRLAGRLNKAILRVRPFVSGREFGFSYLDRDGAFRAVRLTVDGNRATGVSRLGEYEAKLTARRS